MIMNIISVLPCTAAELVNDLIVYTLYHNIVH